VTAHDLLWQMTISVCVFASVYLLARHGWPWLSTWMQRQQSWYQRVLVDQLLYEVDPKAAVGLSLASVLLCGLIAMVLMGNGVWFFIGAAAGVLVPGLVVRHLAQKRAARLEEQLVDGITTLASGVRAGLNLVQSMELLVNNSIGPIRQEFAQMLREYQMGLDLNAAMRKTSNRIGSANYRLLFTAIEMHRQRGGDAGLSLDRIAESIREIQRLQGKLDAITSQGRTQANMMAAAPVALLFILYVISRQEVEQMFIDPAGRLLLFFAVLMIAGAYWWIRKIMAVDM
jgi:tight adherence protein B